MKMSRYFFIVVLLFLNISLYSYKALSQSNCDAVTPQQLKYQLIKSYSHSNNPFTQGLHEQDGILYESSGQYGKSYIQSYDYKTGRTKHKVNLSPKVFAEGLAVVGPNIVVLTWKSRIGYVFDKSSFVKLHEFEYPSEGWGLTFDGKNLIMSDGSSQLYFLNAKTYKIEKVLKVFNQSKSLTRLNELEYINGKIFANIWGSNEVAVIDANNGCKTAWLNLEGLTNYLGPYRRIDVLNGIAYLPKNGHLLVTGKLWPKLFEIKVLTLSRASKIN